MKKSQLSSAEPTVTDWRRTWSWESLPIPLILVTLTTELWPPVPSSDAPQVNSPRNAVVTKKIDVVFTACTELQDSKLSLSNSTRPSVLASACCGAAKSLKKCDTGPTFPELYSHVSVKDMAKYRQFSLLIDENVKFTFPLFNYFHYFFNTFFISNIHLNTIYVIKYVS